MAQKSIKSEEIISFTCGSVVYITGNLGLQQNCALPFEDSQVKTVRVATEFSPGMDDANILT